MKGKILGYNAADGTGAISADDGARYRLAQADWRGERPPVAGMAVDFETDAGVAREVYPLAGAGTSVLGKVDLRALSESGTRAMEAGGIVSLFRRSLAAPLGLFALIACFLPALDTPADTFSLIGLGDALNGLSASSAAAAEILGGESSGSGGLEIPLLLRFIVPLTALWLLWAAWSRKNERIALFAAGGSAILGAILVFVAKSAALADLPDFVRDQVGSALDIGLGVWVLILIGAAMIAAGAGVIRNPLAEA